MGENIRAFVCDGSDDHVIEFMFLLSELGVETQGNCFGHEAIITCEKWHPHLILYDGSNQDMRAWEFAFQLLQGVGPEVRPYLVSVNEKVDGKGRMEALAMECGFDEYHKKPVDRHLVSKWVAQATKNMKQRSGASK